MAISPESPVAEGTVEELRAKLARVGADVARGFCLACGARIPHRRGEGRCERCEHFNTDPPRDATKMSKSNAQPHPLADAPSVNESMRVGCIGAGRYVPEILGPPDWVRVMLGLPTSHT